MPGPYDRPADLPEFMTWEELELLPEEIAGEIELWDGKVMWARRGPAAHQRFTRRVTNAIERCANEAMSDSPGECWEVESEMNVFLQPEQKSDFLTPDFLVTRCLPPTQDIRATDTLLVGEVLSPSNSRAYVEAKMARYAGAGIRSYWEIVLNPHGESIAMISAYGLPDGPPTFPQGVCSLRANKYVLENQWTPGTSTGITMEHPFNAYIPWRDLEW